MRIPSSLISVIVILLGASTVSPAGNLPQDRSQIIWRGKSAGFAIAWTLSDISASTISGKPVFSARENAVRERTESPAGRNSCGDQRTVSLLSVVSSFISIEEGAASCVGDPRSTFETRYTAFDLARQGSRISLLDIFPEEDVVKALLADPVIRKAAGNASAGSIKELMGMLRTSACEFRYTDDLLTRFAFHHIEGGMASIRLSLPEGGTCRGKQTRIDLLLPVPEQLKSALGLADLGYEGFMMESQKKVSAGRTTKLDLAPSR